MNLDDQSTKVVAADKFDIECKLLGISLSRDDLNTIIHLYEDKNRYDHYHKIPSINYDSALKSIVPVLQKNGDKQAYIDKN